MTDMRRRYGTSPPYWWTAEGACAQSTLAAGLVAASEVCPWALGGWWVWVGPVVAEAVAFSNGEPQTEHGQVTDNVAVQTGDDTLGGATDIVCVKQVRVDCSSMVLR